MLHPALTIKSLNPSRRVRFSPVQIGTRVLWQSRFQASEYSTGNGSSSYIGLMDSTASASCIAAGRLYSQWQWTMMS